MLLTDINLGVKVIFNKLIVDIEEKSKHVKTLTESPYLVKRGRG